jgi:hypothetical protein
MIEENNMVYHTPAGDKKHRIKTIEDFQDFTRMMQAVLPDEPPDKDIYILLEVTMETYKWNYRTRTFDLVV